MGPASRKPTDEKKTKKEIADFCENTFGVKFPMFGKSSVRGKDANPLFKELAEQSGGRQPLWNFHKYLVGRDGKVVANFTSMTAPGDKAFLAAIDKQLDAPLPAARN